MVTILFKKTHNLAKIPTLGSEFSAGYDLYSTEEYILKPLERKLFKTGINVAIPIGLYGRIAPRSGLAYKNGLDILAGVIDPDYRSDIGVILINLGYDNKQIMIGDRIAQIIFEHYNSAIFKETDTLPETIRNEDGFGSTDVISPKSEHIGSSNIIDKYTKLGGIPNKKKYIDEIKKSNKDI